MIPVSHHSLPNFPVAVNAQKGELEWCVLRSEALRLGVYTP